METQLDFDYWDQPYLREELIVKTFDDIYSEEYKKASVDTEKMRGFFSNTVKHIIEKYAKKER